MVKMKILLTGGCGFIGSHILDTYLKAGHEVVVVDNFRSGRIENIKHNLGHKNLTCIFGDILKEDFVRSLGTDYDVINHHAAQLEITRCMDFPQEDITSNMIGTTNIFEHAKRCKKLKKVIYASSAAVYGQARSKLQKETDPIDPHWIYGVSKYGTEMLAKIYEQNLRIPFFGLRYSIVYGPREWYGRVLTLFIRNALEDRKVVVFGEGSEVRDFVNVKDAANANLLILNSKNMEGGAYNISSGSDITIRQLAEKIKVASGCEILTEDVKEGEPSKILNKNRIRLPGNLLYLCQDNGKARKELGWEPNMGFDSGLKEEFNWYREAKKTDKGLWERMFY